ncbi:MULTISPECIES: pyridoxal phosphate-dependent aminotransferase [unclassified Chelatococcus]|uniref:pyridoxal phosphate-dependent aminotransferase n=1 Tax=unclassified Chelatococcus TaxID=2638111 RepID=UPI001BCD293C|nr:MULTISPECIES: pyridoxal phosphate-dependent aminotransferase [unclassified Chelatococcus]CAH1654644.1 Aspartate/tyrosine/aromatic aminotransferase [Hyphomicrobiales bacterium]MBS7740277.1 pyridoxal phosphate-dependent aminotransferase [Chelatococcus sp. HY11]MBX3544893.1 pyridoxal phosphate-dependent aminotransferase [Chelatococcus sp.]MCO5078482.1 pyridoxal phosphate-dependent aminotransferase [Chelatococcus sp.]CAH1685358.1 Aspartate/tyrosine/aromatic aminotransferase [Hyphomicrobiales ba
MTYLAKRITESSKKSFGMYARAASLNGAERDLIHMELGSPHADTPEPIKLATIRALMEGNVHYSHLQGIPKLRKALAEKLASNNSLDYSPEEIVITNGLTHASFAAFMAFLDPGDEVILLEPYYPQHVGKIELAGAKPVFAKLDAANRFSINPALIKEKITPKTKMIALINPCNPTGRVYTREELQDLADLAIKHDLLIASDEVYEEILFDTAKHISIASLPGMRERTISMFAFTKSFAMDGWRIGYLTAPANLIEGILKITANDVTHVNTFIQEGAFAAVTGPSEILQELVAEDRIKRDIVVSRLNQMPGITCDWPEGTIYAFPNIAALGIPAQMLAETILEKADVVVEAGSFYGAAGEGHLRVCFGSQSTARVAEAMDRLQHFFGSL